MIELNVQSEIGRLESVLLHTPGPEVENMTPGTAQRALYSDILNLSIAREEYRQLKGVLSMVADTFEVSDLLRTTLADPVAREELIDRICISEDVQDYYDVLMAMDSSKLAEVLIEGLPARVDSLTSFLKNDYYALNPLYNFYFTRDAAVTIGGSLLVSTMANKVREREAMIMNALFSNKALFGCRVIGTHLSGAADGVSIEGGDVLILREDIILVGNGVRTSTQGIDALVSRLCEVPFEGRRHIIVQQLPDSPESFIHMDMVFTMIDEDKCLVHSPVILNDSILRTVHITIEKGRVSRINYVADILSVLKRLGMDLEPVVCGGSDEWNREREQWHSGANSFAFAPGKILVYARNVNTLEELDRHGFRIVPADDIISGKAGLDGKIAVTISGSELPRGGGGARCMTMPLRRAALPSHDRSASRG